MISMFFKAQEEILPEAITNYINVTSKNVNNFNHIIDTHIVTSGEIGTHQKKYQKQKNIISTSQSPTVVSESVKEISKIKSEFDLM